MRFARSLDCLKLILQHSSCRGHRSNLPGKWSRQQLHGPRGKTGDHADGCVRFAVSKMQRKRHGGLKRKAGNRRRKPPDE